MSSSYLSTISGFQNKKYYKIDPPKSGHFIPENTFRFNFLLNSSWNIAILNFIIKWDVGETSHIIFLLFFKQGYFYRYNTQFKLRIFRKNEHHLLFSQLYVNDCFSCSKIFKFPPSGQINDADTAWSSNDKMNSASVCPGIRAYFRLSNLLRT